jgi:hypothetical protein
MAVGSAARRGLTKRPNTRPRCRRLGTRPRATSERTAHICARTTSTGQGAFRITSSATLPNSARETPERPWLAMTMTSADHSLAVSTMRGAGIPICAKSCAAGGSERRSRKPLRNVLLRSSDWSNSALTSTTLIRAISLPSARPSSAPSSQARSDIGWPSTAIRILRKLIVPRAREKLPHRKLVDCACMVLN